MMFVIFIITFILFLLEALLHFHIGAKTNTDKTAHKTINIGFTNLNIPNGGEFIEIVSVLTIFSMLNSIFANYFIDNEKSC